jgi:hypothetical protein
VTEARTHNTNNPHRHAPLHAGIWRPLPEAPWKSRPPARSQIFPGTVGRQVDYCTLARYSRSRSSNRSPIRRTSRITAHSLTHARLSRSAPSLPFPSQQLRRHETRRGTVALNSSKKQNPGGHHRPLMFPPNNPFHSPQPTNQPRHTSLFPSRPWHRAHHLRLLVGAETRGALLQGVDQ